MNARISVITLGVDDLHKSVEFYRALGLETDGIVGEEFDHGAVAFFELEGGVRLALWPRTSIAHDTGLPLYSTSATELTLGHNVNSKSEVDDVMAQAKSAGATIIKSAHHTFWGGYAGYFQDIDGHVWKLSGTRNSSLNSSHLSSFASAQSRWPALVPRDRKIGTLCRYLIQETPANRVTWSQ